MTNWVELFAFKLWKCLKNVFRGSQGDQNNETLVVMALVQETQCG